MQKCIFFDFFCQNIWSYEKFVVLLQAFSRERDEYTHVRINKNMFGHAENTRNIY